MNLEQSHKVYEARSRGGLGSIANFRVTSDDGISKTGLHVWDDAMLDGGISARRRADEPSVLHLVIAALERWGFTVRTDREAKRRWPSIAAGHLRGYVLGGRLRVELQRSGRHLEAKFYADPCDPEDHDMPRHARHVGAHLPYLERVRLRGAVADIAARLAAAGFSDFSEPEPADTVEQLEWRMRRSGHWVDGDRSIDDCPGWLKQREGSYYAAHNRVDTEGAPVVHGETRVYYGWRDGLHRGRVFIGLNQQWEGASSCISYLMHGGPKGHIIGRATAARLSTYVPLDGGLPRAPRRTLPRVQQHVRLAALVKRLDLLVKAEDFERAIPVRNLLRAEKEKS